MELNDKNIRDAKPGDTLVDDKVSGLSLRVFPLKKSFYLYYRTKDGTQRRPKIGDYKYMSVAQARIVAKTMLSKVQLGSDPSGEAKASKEDHTVRELWEAFKFHYENNRRKKVKSLTWEQYQRSYRLYIEPRFANKKITAITYTDVSMMMAELSNKPVTANRAQMLFSQMFNFAVDPLDWLVKNPISKVERYQEVSRKRYMEGEEAARISEILFRDRNKHPAEIAFIYLLILTGARSSEIKNAKWSMIQGNKIVLKEHKTDRLGDDRIVRLPATAMEILDKLPQVEGGTITGIKSPGYYWEKVRREAGCPDLRLHDLRHSFASAALSAGLSLAQIGELLGHKSAQTTKRYAHLVDETAEAAATVAADHIMSQMKLPLLTVS